MFKAFATASLASASMAVDINASRWNPAEGKAKDDADMTGLWSPSPATETADASDTPWIIPASWKKYEHDPSHKSYTHVHPHEEEEKKEKKAKKEKKKRSPKKERSPKKDKKQK